MFENDAAIHDSSCSPSGREMVTSDSHCECLIVSMGERDAVTSTVTEYSDSIPLGECGSYGE